MVEEKRYFIHGTRRGYSALPYLMFWLLKATNGCIMQPFVVNVICVYLFLLVYYSVIGKLTVILLPLAIASRAVQSLSSLRATIAQNAARLAYNLE